MQQAKQVLAKLNREALACYDLAQKLQNCPSTIVVRVRGQTRGVFDSCACWLGVGLAGGPARAGGAGPAPTPCGSYFALTFCASFAFSTR